MADQLYLMHHAPAPRRAHEIVGSGTDRDLDEYGKYLAELQANRLGNALQRGLVENIGKTIISSPLRRAVHTAEIVAEVNSLDIVVEDNFTAQNFGVLEGMTFSEIEQNPQLAQNLWGHIPPDSRTNHQVPGGESNGAFAQRILRVRNDIMRGWDVNPIVITHGSVIDVLISQHSNLRLDEVEGANRRYEGRIIKESNQGFTALGKQGEQFCHVPGVEELVEAEDIASIKLIIEDYIAAEVVREEERTHLHKLLSFL